MVKGIEEYSLYTWSRTTRIKTSNVVCMWISTLLQQPLWIEINLDEVLDEVRSIA